MDCRGSVFAYLTLQQWNWVIGTGGAVKQVGHWLVNMGKEAEQDSTIGLLPIAEYGVHQERPSDCGTHGWECGLPLGGPQNRPTCKLWGFKGEVSGQLLIGSQLDGSWSGQVACLTKARGSVSQRMMPAWSVLHPLGFDHFNK